MAPSFCLGFAPLLGFREEGWGGVSLGWEREERVLRERMIQGLATVSSKYLWTN